jgi:hypothetical protein
MKKISSITGQLMYFFFLSVPLALTIYIVLHVGIFIYVIYKQIKSLCQRITTK